MKPSAFWDRKSGCGLYSDQEALHGFPYGVCWISGALKNIRTPCCIWHSELLLGAHKRGMKAKACLCPVNGIWRDPGSDLGDSI